MTSTFHNSIILSLFFASGMVSLIYEVLWLKELGLLFGNTAYASATTLAVFFAGLSAGGYFWGQRAAQTASPLRVYAWLEFGIGLAALSYFLIRDFYYLIYEPLFSTFGDLPAVFTFVKFLLAAGLLFLPSFLMGGTLPIMGQHLVRQADQLGKTASMLYAVNTLGAALGVFLAGFYLPFLLGFTNSYVSAVGLNIVIAAAAYGLSFTAPGKTISDISLSPHVSSTSRPTDLSPQLIWSIAFLSGFMTLGLEVLWTRMFAQVLHNSVYSFSTILITFLLALACGAILANVLCRLQFDPKYVLAVLLIASGILVGLSSHFFYSLTDGLRYMARKEAWDTYIQTVFTNAALIMLLPGMLMGSVFPYLLKITQGWQSSAGKLIGQLASVNTLGSILGSLGAGFLLLSYAGLWASIKLMAVGYFLLALFVGQQGGRRSLLLQAVPVVCILVFVSFLDTARLPLLKLNPKRESLFEVWESKHGVVSVIKRGKDIKLKVDNYYSLGGVAGREYEERQGQLPLSIHPDPKSVFFLGMGTGITAGAALDNPAVEKVVVSELIPEVVTAAEKYFAKYTNELFTDERVNIVVEDGRNYLQGMSETYDVIISDLFIPWHAGTGSLYSREHYQTALSRLKPGGMFTQWVPLFQVSRDEFLIIAKTMLAVFPQVTLWRGDFLPKKPIVGLIGHNDDRPLTLDHLGSGADRVSQLKKTMTGLFYAGNLTKSAEQKAEFFTDVPLNTDDHPLVEYLAPITHRNQRAREASWFALTPLVNFYDRVFTLVPPENDPYLRNLSEQETSHVYAGLSFFKAHVYKETKEAKKAETFLKDFLARVPEEIRPSIMGGKN